MNVQSVERAFRILDTLSMSPAGVSNVAIRVGLPKSTVSRLLTTLEGIGAVDRVEGSSDYRIGSRIADLLGGYDATATMAAAVAPYLARLAGNLGEAVGFSVPDGYRVRYVAQVDTDTPVQVRDWTGSTLPMHVVPSGLVIMAHWPTERITRYVDRDLEVFTRQSVVKPDEIRKRLAGIRDSGVAWVFEEFAEGINSVAAPVVDGSGRVSGAIHVHGPAFRFPVPARIADVGDAVRTAAAAFSARLTGVDQSGVAGGSRAADR